VTGSAAAGCCWPAPPRSAPEKAGSAASISETSGEFGVALGLAVLAAVAFRQVPATRTAPVNVDEAPHLVPVAVPADAVA
jgi:DHA2 family multidrug resistance protein-like MFS transporter